MKHSKFQLISYNAKNFKTNAEKDITNCIKDIEKMNKRMEMNQTSMKS